ncbi:MAG: arginine--tRNA ligase [Patescibacteria group bacterium]|nr:arginine--tRNA ligase [Patescibacteria group bacterium]
MMLSDTMREKIKKIILKCVSVKADFEISKSPRADFGDYSSNIALKIAAEKHENPLVVAEELKERIFKLAPKGFFLKIEAARPGFLNFFLSPEILEKEFYEIFKKNYGRGSAKKEKIQLEFISANPTGPLTLANGRGGFWGDVLARIFEFSGYKIEREYYVNDTGNQILTLGKSALAFLGIIPDEENFYQGDYLRKWAAENESFIKKNKIKPVLVGEKAAAYFLKEIKKVLTAADIKFNRFTSEKKEIHQKGLINEVLKIFKKSELVYERDGALWLKTTNFGDDKDRVLITSDKFPTYFLADAAHYLETKKRGFAKKIIILGPDHYGYVKRIQAAAQIIGLKKSEVLITQTVRLVSGGEEVKMSKRKGEFITFEDLIKDVGVDAARHFFLMTSLSTHLDFDLALAKERSVKNPVYYIQYAYVRAKKIIEKAGKIKGKIHPPIFFKKDRRVNFRLLGEPADLNLIKKMIEFSDIIEKISLNYEANHLAIYAQELAAAFHNFYEKERIIGIDDKDLALSRLALVRAYLIVLGRALDILGISKPEEM